MSSSYGRLAAIRDYWLPRNIDARVEVRVTDIDETLREQVRLSTLAADYLVEIERLKAAEADAARFKALADSAREQLLNPKHANNDFFQDHRTHWVLPTLMCSGPVGGFLTFRESVDAFLRRAVLENTNG